MTAQPAHAARKPLHQILRPVFRPALHTTSRPWSRSPLSALPAALLACSLCIASQGQAQTVNDSPAAWRVTSRLGYGPNASSAKDALQDPKAWARKQIDDAYAASQTAARIPNDLAAFNAPLNELATGVFIQNEERRIARDVAKNPASAASMAMTAGSASSNTASTTVVATPVPRREFSREMQQTALAWRVMACSDAAVEQPLLARMTEFWFNHLNVYTGKGTVQPFVGHYVVNVIRHNALGKFEDMLLASARHPAMLYYLDQAESKAKGLNENYARELMELHTLGVNGGYTQNDVRELARILTGRSVGLREGEGFRFNAGQHDKGDKVLMGRNFRNDGVAEGDEAIRMLARHPATAKRIAQRLATTFISDNPSPAVVERLASSFTRSQGDIRAVMNTLVESPEFWQADQRLFKTPMDFACSALTATGGVKNPKDIQQALGFLNQAGQAMHGWQTPDGYKTDAATWLAPEALTRRADYALNLGKNTAAPSYLQPFFSASSLERIQREAPAMHTGLMLASPDFMSK
jgi:uncharacterized protein (DUF1800 family)